MARSMPPEHEALPESVSERVVAEVADATGTDRTALDPLYDAVDPDALDSLFAPGDISGANTPIRVTFTYSGREVVVSNGGSVSVTGHD